MSNPKDVKWTEKYRPSSVVDIIGQEHVKRELLKAIEKENLMSYMFTGIAGIGKTTAANAIAQDLFGEEWKNNMLELNASDERGIDVIRTKVKNFVTSKTMNPLGFTILFLDEADALTSDAQAALRRTMERYEHNCRFILSCNYPNKIIEPIQSRCRTLPFKMPSNADMDELITRIATNEGFTITDGAKAHLIQASHGDMRRIVNTLQASANISNEIDESIINITSMMPDEQGVRNMIADARNGNFAEARMQLIDQYIGNGLDGASILRTMESVIFDMNFHPITLQKLHSLIGQIDGRLMDGANPTIQLATFLSAVSLFSQVPVHCQNCAND